MSVPLVQTNFFKFQLHNSLNSSPVAHVCIHTNRAQVSKNYITLGIPASLMVKAALGSINTYVNERLQHLGASLVKYRLSILCNEEAAGRALSGDIAPSHIEVPNYLDARRVIDDLFTHNEMSANDRAGMENALRELEKSARFSTLRAESISTAQKDVIQSVISPYIDDIKSEAPDSETAKNWVKCAANTLRICGPSAKDNLPSLLLTSCRSGDGKSRAFYECLFAVSKIYANMGDLEGVLEQYGDALPSNSIIQQTILELFD